MKLALVYDRVNKFGGAERVITALHELWPDAPLYTSVYDKKRAAWADGIDVRPSFLQRLGLARHNHEYFPFLMPFVFESFDFDDFDVVISIASEAAKGIITRPGTLHICYCLTPTRYLWSGYDEYFRHPLVRRASAPVVRHLRRWDHVAGHRPDVYIAISEEVRKRIGKYYGRDSLIIYPPVESHKFYPGKNSPSSYLLVVSRLVGYKRVDLAIEAANRLGIPLKIVGSGKDLPKLKKIAGPHTEFLGNLTDEKLLFYYQNCRAVIFPQEEDFGIVPLEAQASGKPVIAFRGGGALETVTSRTGVFFYPQTVESLMNAITQLESITIDPQECVRQADKFNTANFQKTFMDTVENLYDSFQKGELA